MTGGTADVRKALSYSDGLKVHHVMCKELIKSVDKITQIFPAIESAQPRCRSGIDALCSLNIALEKAELLIQHCTESSKLYLVVTKDAIKSRCERVQNLFGQSLSQIQSMMPLLLAAQISSIIDDLKHAKFVMDSFDEEAGNVLLRLLHNASNSTEESESDAFHTAALRLQLTSSKALLIEKRSIKKLHDKVQDTDQAKARILKFLLYLLRKYGHSVGDARTVNSTTKNKEEGVCLTRSCNGDACSESIEPVHHMDAAVYEFQSDVACEVMLPDEFRCPISCRLIHDPVVIASGQTFERVWIEKWFQEGNDTCPKTQIKLSHLSIVPNSAMKDLIFKWCSKHQISVPGPASQPNPGEVYQWKSSSSCSIASFNSSLNNVPIRHVDSSVSFGSPDVSLVAPEMITERLVSQQDNDNFEMDSYVRDSNTLLKLCELSWECQCRVMEDVTDNCDGNEHACNYVLCTEFVHTLVRFFKEACDRSDVKAQRLGARVLQMFVTKSRDEVPSVYEDIFYLMVSFLDSDITEEALAVIEVLSGEDCCEVEVVASGVLTSIMKIVESQQRKLQICAMKILCNLSSQSNIGTQIVRLGYIPKLILLLGDRSLAPYCINIFGKVCTNKEVGLAVGETNKFIASIVELLETGSHEEQEHAVGILLALCYYRVEYCQMVLEEGVIPSLVLISINGNAKGKENAMELLGLLRDRCSDFENSSSPTGTAPELPQESVNFPTRRQSISKVPGYFRRKMRFFSKPKPVALY